MTFILDQKYAQIIGHHLDRYTITKTTPFEAHFRCNVCGDSKKNKLKARGHFYTINDKLMVKCFNCGYSSSFKTYLGQFFPEESKNYYFDQYKDNQILNDNPISFKNDKKIDSNQLLLIQNFNLLPTIDFLPINHFARKYVESRKIPIKEFCNIRYAENYKKFINNLIPNKFKHVEEDDHRIVFLFKDLSGNITGCSGRSIEINNKPASKIRYISISFKENERKIYGLEYFKSNKPYTFITEGQIDSLFLKSEESNSLSIGGSDLDFNNPFIQSIKHNAIMIYDNQPRNREIVNIMKKVIHNNFSVFIWPKDLIGKDINDLVINYNFSIKQLINLITNNNYNNLKAQIEFNNWKKIT